ncbi:MAG: PAS domain S-box-containing protein [Flavobacterium sp.]|jgi:PAS domain S-box-containing protein
MKISHNSSKVFQSIFEVYSQPILVIDRYGIITQANVAACKFFAFAKVELIGLKLNILFPKIDKKTENHKHIWINKKDGSQVLVDLQIHTVHNNDIAETIVYITDAKVSLNYQRVLKGNQKYLLNTESEGNVGNWHWVFETDERYWSDEFYRICGLPPGDNRLNAQTAESFIHPDDRESALKTVNYAIENKTQYNYEKRILRLDGTIRYTKARGKVDYDSKGKSIGISGTLQDITQIKKTEIALKKEKNLLYNYMNSSSSIFLVINANHKIEFANRKACEVLKVLDSEIIGKDWFDSFIPKRNRKQLSTMFDQIMKGEIVPPDGYENIVLVENEERLIQWRNGLLRDKNKQLISILSSGIDITEQTKNEKKINENRDKNIALSNAVQDMMFIQDSKGILLEYHVPDPKKILIPVNQIIGNNMEKIFPPHVYELINKTQSSVFKKKRLEFIEYTLNENKKTIYYEARITSMNGAKLLTIIRDISVEKTLEKKFNKSKEKLKKHAQNLEKKVEKRTEELMATIEQLVASNLNLEDQIQETQLAERNALANKSISTGIARNFPNGFIIVFNPEFEILLKEGQSIRKLKLEKVLSEGMRVDEVTIFSLQQKEKLKEQISKTIEGSHLNLEIEYENKHFAINTSPLFNERGIISSALFVYNDITIQKKTELKVQNALKKEQELNELKSRFVSMASHEFRTPLSAILTSAILIGKQNEVGKEEKRIKFVNQIKNNVKRLVIILNDFLSLSKLEEGKVIANREEFDFIAFSKTIIKEISITKKTGQSLIFSSSETELLLNLDKKLVRHILMNLLSNAIKYSPENASINLNVEEDDQYIFLEIKDQGIGIPEDEQAKLFGLFFRARNTQNIEGTGLGLNIVKQYVELLDGTIDFKSEINKGATFLVKWPKPNKK